MAQRVRTYHKRSAIQQPATDQVTGSIPYKILLFLITSLVVSQGSSLTVDICNITRNADYSKYSLPEVGSGFLHRLQDKEQGFALFGSSLYILTRDEENRSTARTAVV
jgi:hypothetical protein